LYPKTPDGLHIAYQVAGDGPIDLVAMHSGFSHVELDWEGPVLARFLRRLASFTRLIVFDMRGLGLSDPVTPRDWPTLEQRAQDLLAVLDAVGSTRPALLGGLGAGQMMMFFASTYPDRTAALVLVGTAARFT
jgi:pimeloyl-ACP methyl ester carboxylesterase